MSALKNSKTEENLKAAFAGESQANRRYLYFAQKADIEGYNDVSAVFRSTAEGETGHAHGHLEYLEEVGDPATGNADRRRPRITCAPRLPAKPTNTPTCIRAWPGRRARKVSRRSPSGSRPSPRPRSLMPAVSKRLSTRSEPTCSASNPEAFQARGAPERELLRPFSSSLRREQR